MIVQDNPAGHGGFVMTMGQHTVFADCLAEAYGNHQFDQINDPNVRYVIAHHDAGWKEVDAEVHVNPNTGLPYHLSCTPYELTSKTMRGSPDFNSAYHPLSGLVSSMHTVGLLNGRYGLAPPGIIDKFEGEKKLVAEQVIAHETIRQEGLWPKVGVGRAAVWRAYKQLQFFDMLSLYFHSQASGSRGENSFYNVPASGGKDVTMTIKEIALGIYSLHPYPFAHDPVRFSFEGRWMMPAYGVITSKNVFASTPVSLQMITLTSSR
ncbi:MAG: DUF3891 family protein [Rhodospirillaceae bacterium]